jgi:hypothetical protein
MPEGLDVSGLPQHLKTIRVNSISGHFIVNA